MIDKVSLHDSAKALIGEKVHIERYYEAGSQDETAGYDPFASIPPEPPAFLRREDVVGQIVPKLIEHDLDIGLFALWGRGGVGKTCIAQAISLDARVQRRFPDGVIWQHVGRIPDTLPARVREIAERLNTGRVFARYDATTYRTLMNERRVLLVLDDVWEFADVQPFLLGSATKNRSRVLITSRKQQIFNRPDIAKFAVDVLDSATARAFLHNRSGYKVAGLAMPEPEATEILDACRGYVLALAMAGGILFGKSNATWKRISHRLKQRRESFLNEELPPEYLDAYSSGDHIRSGRATLLGCISLSVDELPERLQQQYQLLAALPEDWVADRRLLGCLWGTEPDETEDMIEKFIGASLASGSVEAGITIHDFLWEYVSKLFGDPEGLAIIHRSVTRSSHVIRKDGSQFAVQVAARLLPHRAVAGISTFMDALEAHAPRPRLWPLLPARVPPDPADEGVPEPQSRKIYAVALDALGRHAVSGSIDKTLYFWDLEGDGQLSVRQGHTDLVSAVALDAAGERAISGSYDTTVRVWNLHKDAEPRVLQGHTGGILAVGFDGSGRRAVSASSDNTVRIWNLEDGAEPVVVKIRIGRTAAIALDRAGRRALTGSPDYGVLVWELADPSSPRVLSGHSNTITAVAFDSASRRAISGSADNTVRVWELTGDAEPHILKGHMASITAVAFHSSGKLAISASFDHVLHVWDVEAERCLTTFTCDAPVLSCAWSGDKILAVDGMGQMHLFRWDGLPSP